jgi:hypothetical protein
VVQGQVSLLQPMGCVVGVSAAATDSEAEQLPEDEGPVVVPLEGAGEGVQVTGVGGDVVDDDLQLAADIEASAAQTDAWVVIKDGSGERRIHKSSFVREKFGRKATSNDRARRVQSMYGGMPLVGMGSAAGNKLKKMVCKDDPLSTLVKVGGRSALAVVHITHFVAPGHEAPFSLPQSVAFAAGTIVHANVLQLLPVGGVHNDALWQWDGRRIASVVVPGPQASPINPEIAPCNVSADSPMAACITYEFPGSLLKLIYDEGMSAVSIQRVVLPTVSKLTATAEFSYRLGGVWMSCE